MASTIHDKYAKAVASQKLIADPAQQVILPALEELHSHLNNTVSPTGLRKMFSKDPQPVKGLYLWGGVGVGKSMLIDLFVDAVNAPKRRVHFHEFMQEVHTALHRARKSGAKDALKPVAKAISDKVRLLALDEMQINDITDAMIVGRLFEQLMASGVILMTTSNRQPDDLYKDGLNRSLFLPFIELMKTRLDVHELSSPIDYRQGQLAGRAVYFHPANAEAKNAIDEIWNELAGGPGKTLVLHLKERTTEIPLFRNGVARAQFWDLCGKPLGPADYLALSDAVRVLILENVPRLGRTNYNEAKRFVMLIDTLYEANVRLVVSAADVPERLYLEGTGAFEFERTASRLQEMQSKDWANQR